MKRMVETSQHEFVNLDSHVVAIGLGLLMGERLDALTRWWKQDRVCGFRSSCLIQNFWGEMRGYLDLSLGFINCR